MTKFRRYPISNFYGENIKDYADKKKFLKKELNIGNFFSLNFCKGFKMLTENSFHVEKTPIALFEGFAFILPTLAAAAAGATLGILFLKPVIEEAIADALANSVSEVANEAIKQAVSISTIVIGTTLTAAIVGVAVKNLVALIIYAIDEARSK